MTCPQCGAPAAAGAKFCANCGRPIAAAPPAPAKPTPAAPAGPPKRRVLPLLLWAVAAVLTVVAYQEYTAASANCFSADCFGIPGSAKTLWGLAVAAGIAGFATWR